MRASENQSIDERYQSYNVEMLEVASGKFWKSYEEIKKAAAYPGSKDEAKSGGAPAGMDPGLYQYRAPLNFTNKRLRAMAQALAPAYMRVSGTWGEHHLFCQHERIAEGTTQRAAIYFRVEGPDRRTL